MSFTSWLSERMPLSSRTSGLALRPAFKRRSRIAPRSFRTGFEDLEGRRMLSTLPVTNTLDDIAQRGTLRYAMNTRPNAGL